MPLVCIYFLRLLCPLCHGSSVTPIPQNAFRRKITAFRWLSPFLSLSPPPAPYKTLATLKENSPTTCQFYIGHKDNFCWERGGKRDWSLAVPFHRQGSLWRSENTSCIKIQHTLWVQGWGAEATMYQQCPQTNGNACPNPPNRKVIFSQNVSAFLPY